MSRFKNEDVIRHELVAQDRRGLRPRGADAEIARGQVMRATAKRRSKLAGRSSIWWWTARIWSACADADATVASRHRSRGA